MMTKTKTSRFGGTKLLLAFPALALLLFAFAEPVYKVNNKESVNPVSSLHQGEKKFIMKGKVIQEETGKPMPGASVIIKGTTVGTVSDEKGNFTLIDPNPQKGENGGYFTDVVISYVGRETEQVSVSSLGNELETAVPDIKMKEGIFVIDPNDLKTPPPSVKKDKKSQIPPPLPPVNVEEEETFIVVEELPKYPGGFPALADYISEMEKKYAQSKNVSGNSKVAFTISESGKVTDVRIVEQDNEEAGKAAANIAMNMQDWTPGKQRGKAVPVNYLLPITFN